MKSSSVLHLKCQDNIETEDSVAMETTVCGYNLTCLQALIGAEQDILISKTTLTVTYRPPLSTR